MHIISSSFSNKLTNILKVQFHLYLVSVHLLECRKWSAVPISACLRCGPRSCFHNECCTGCKSMAASHLNCSFALTHDPSMPSTGCKYHFFCVRFDPVKNRTLPSSIGGTCQPTVPYSRLTL